MKHHTDEGGRAHGGSGEEIELGDDDLVEPPTVLLAGRYELLGLVGAGAYGAVYRANDHTFNEIVALKVLRREHLTQPAALERFREEIRIARRISHVNVVRTYNLDEHNGERLLSMEFIDGVRLTNFCRIGARAQELLPLSAVIDAATQLCAALVALHEAHIVHCDLKPDNVMVTAEGRVVLTDFGIARLLQNGRMVPVTSGDISDVISGTPVYMAPEQVRGASTVDSRADLYAFGIILFQLLTGTVPFLQQTAMATALARLGEPAPDPRSLRPDRAELPAALCSIVARCLVREPEARFGSAHQLAEALRAVGLSGPTLAEYLQQRRRAGLVPEVERAPIRGDEETLLAGTPAPASHVAPAPAPASVPAPARPPEPQPPRIRLAVLLFEGRGDTEVPGYALHGLTQSVIEALNEILALEVKSYRSILTVAGSSQDPWQIGRRLRVQAVVHGSLWVLPSGLRATVRAIEVEGQVQFAARRFARSDRNVLAFAREIASELSRLLTSELRPCVEALDEDEVAADLFMRARHQYNALDLPGARESAQLLEQALLRQPHSPRLLSAYALTLARMWAHGSHATEAQVKGAVARAVQSAPTQGEPLVALATVQLQSGEPQAAAGSLRLALQAAPRLTEAHEVRARLLSESGPIELALNQLRYSHALDTQSVRSRVDLIRVLSYLGRWEEGMAMLRPMIRSGREGPFLWYVLTRTLVWRRDVEGAREYLKDPAMASPEYDLPRKCMELLLGLREFEPADYMPPPEVMAQVSPRSCSFHYQRLAEMHALVGQIDGALQALQQSVELGLCDLMWMEHCPLLEGLRERPEFVRAKDVVSARALRIREELGLHAPAAREGSSAA